MSRIRSADTGPEKRVRSLLHKLGYRFRLHRKDLPGRPDLVLPRHRTVVFIHGCFWHKHGRCKRANIPKSNLEYWEPKLKRNKERDKRNTRNLKSSGWKVMVVWECMTKDAENLKKYLSSNLKGL